MKKKNKKKLEENKTPLKVMLVDSISSLNERLYIMR
jgi:hypothetical protein